jgi:HSP20 family molecular chaperone IbpA
MGTLAKKNLGFSALRDILNKMTSSPSNEDLFAIFDDDGADYLCLKVDVSETSDKFTLAVELPGMTPEDFKVEVTSDAVVISGEKKNENEEGKERYHLFERRYGSFERKLRFPTFIDKDKVTASFKNGVLKLELPKKEVKDSRKIIEIVEE